MLRTTAARSPAAEWAAVHSTGVSSVTACAISSSRGSVRLTAHDLGDPHERATHEHAGGVRGRLADRFGNLLVLEVELDPQNDGLPLLLGQLDQGGFIALDRLAADHFFERRPARIGDVRVGLAGGLRPARTPDL